MALLALEGLISLIYIFWNSKLSSQAVLQFSVVFDFLLSAKGAEINVQTSEHYPNITET